MRQGGVGAINCTSCGAGLSVLGGGRVRVHVCGYCGAELDAQDAYSVLMKVAAAPRPQSPFRIGMTGPIRGVTFTVIGTLGMRERHAGQSWHWVDHQIYSPTHGYAWLSWEDGHVTLSRKLRAVPSPAVMTLADIERAESRPAAKVGGARFRYYESGRHEVAFAEGEFNYRVHVGDTVQVVSLIAATRMLHYVAAGDEIEYEVEEYLDPGGTLRAFEAAEQAGPSGPPHPLAIPPEPPLRRFAMKVAFGVAALNGLLWLADGPGEPVAIRQPLGPGEPSAIGFTVPDPPPLMAIEITGNLENAWAAFEIGIETEDGEDVLYFEREIGFYRGVEQGESWSEDDSTARVSFRLDPPGEYVARVVPAGGGVEPYSGGDTDQLQSYGVALYRDAPASFWLALAAGLSLMTGLGLLGLRGLRHGRRFRGSDWSDE